MHVVVAAVAVNGAAGGELALVVLAVAGGVGKRNRLAIGGVQRIQGHVAVIGGGLAGFEIHAAKLVCPFGPGGGHQRQNEQRGQKFSFERSQCFHGFHAQFRQVAPAPQGQN